MDKENRKLLDEVIHNRLDEALNSDANDEDNAAFKQAMEAIDRRIKLSELDATSDEQTKKLESTKEEAKKDRWIRIAEVCAIPVVLVGFQHACNMRYARTLCNFEKDYTFTTSAGRAMSRFFNFKGKN